MYYYYLPVINEYQIADILTENIQVIYITWCWYVKSSNITDKCIPIWYLVYSKRDPYAINLFHVQFMNIKDIVNYIDPPEPICDDGGKSIA